MDKETLSNYGWIVICTLVLAVMIALATPFGQFVSDGIWSITNGFNDTLNKNLSIGGLDVNGVPNVSLNDFYTQYDYMILSQVDNGFKIEKLEGGDREHSLACLKLFVPANSSYNIKFTLVDNFTVSDSNNICYLSSAEYSLNEMEIHRFFAFSKYYGVKWPCDFSYNFPVSETDAYYYLIVRILPRSYGWSGYVILDNFSFGPIK